MSESYKQVIVLREDLGISKGKLVSQGAHASVRAYKYSDNTREWEDSGSKKVIVAVDSGDELIRLKDEAERLGISTALIKDMGLTEIPPGTMTALGLGPDTEKKLDRVTGDLPLMD